MQGESYAHLLLWSQRSQVKVGKTNYWFFYWTLFLVKSETKHLFDITLVWFPDQAFSWRKNQIATYLLLKPEEWKASRNNFIFQSYSPGISEILNSMVQFCCTNCCPKGMPCLHKCYRFIVAIVATPHQPTHGESINQANGTKSCKIVSLTLVLCILLPFYYILFNVHGWKKSLQLFFMWTNVRFHKTT